MIVLLAGTGNVNDDSPDQIEEGLKELVGAYRKRCPTAHILPLGVFPRDQSATSWIRPRIAKINQILATYDDGKRVIFLDIGARFLQPDGSLPADVMPDFLHPSAKGYGIWADAIQPIVDRYVPRPTGK